MATCASPECSEPGTSFCSSCGLVKYCGRTCQTNDWPRHKKEEGHLRKVGITHLQKAEGFERERNFVKSLRSSELALTQLEQLNSRPLDVVEVMDNALRMKYNAMNFLDQKKEALECARERYSLWAAGHMRDPGMFRATFPLIDGLLHNHEYEEAVLIASTINEMIINDADNIISEAEKQYFLAESAQYLAQATYRLAKSGGIAPEAMQKAGVKAIALSRKALEIDTQLHGTESHQVAACMGTLASILKFFNGVDDDEIFRLYEKTIVIYIQLQGNLSPNVAANENNLGNAYRRRADVAADAHDMDDCVVKLELALTHYREAARIYLAINRVDQSARNIVAVEELLRQIRSKVVVSG